MPGRQQSAVRANGERHQVMGGVADRRRSSGTDLEQASVGGGVEPAVVDNQLMDVTHVDGSGASGGLTRRTTCGGSNDRCGEHPDQQQGSK